MPPPGSDYLRMCTYMDHTPVWGRFGVIAKYPKRIWLLLIVTAFHQVQLEVRSFSRVKPRLRTWIWFKLTVCIGDYPRSIEKGRFLSMFNATEILHR